MDKYEAALSRHLKDNTFRVIKGLEYPGCINSGRRPVIIKCRLGGVTRYVVGPENDVEEHYMELCRTNRRRKSGARKVTKERALATFRKMNDVVLEEHRKYAEKWAIYRKLMKEGKVEEAVNERIDL